jgi:hypothetical protein
MAIPPRSNAVERADTEAFCQRDNHIASINTDGSLKWHASTGYGKRALVETAVGPNKVGAGRRLRACSFQSH